MGKMKHYIVPIQINVVFLYLMAIVGPPRRERCSV